MAKNTENITPQSMKRKQAGSSTALEGMGSNKRRSGTLPATPTPTKSSGKFNIILQSVTLSNFSLCGNFVNQFRLESSIYKLSNCKAISIFEATADKYEGELGQFIQRGGLQFQQCRIVGNSYKQSRWPSRCIDSQVSGYPEAILW